jgi:hypothetical protein
LKKKEDNPDIMLPRVSLTCNNTSTGSLQLHVCAVEDLESCKIMSVKRDSSAKRSKDFVNTANIQKHQKIFWCIAAIELLSSLEIYLEQESPATTETKTTPEEPIAQTSSKIYWPDLSFPRLVNHLYGEAAMLCDDVPCCPIRSQILAHSPRAVFSWGCFHIWYGSLSSPLKPRATFSGDQKSGGGGRQMSKWKNENKTDAAKEMTKLMQRARLTDNGRRHLRLLKTKNVQKKVHEIRDICNLCHHKWMTGRASANLLCGPPQAKHQLDSSQNHVFSALQAMR